MCPNSAPSSGFLNSSLNSSSPSMPCATKSFWEGQRGEEKLSSINAVQYGSALQSVIYGFRYIGSIAMTSGNLTWTDGVLSMNCSLNGSMTAWSRSHEMASNFFGMGQVSLSNTLEAIRLNQRGKELRFRLSYTTRLPNYSNQGFDSYVGGSA